jgi:tetratricopeptide (TPR) repeat protein
MMKLRVKGKHLVAALMMLLIFSGSAYAVAPAWLYQRGQALAAAGKPELEQAHYNFLARFFPWSSKAPAALYFCAQQHAGGFINIEEPGLIYIFPGSTSMSGSPGSKNDLQKAIEKFELLLEKYPESPWAGHALRELGKAYYALGDYDTAAGYFAASIEESRMQSAESVEMLARINLARGQNREALELLERSLTEKPGLNPLIMMELKGQALMALGEWAAARQVFEAIPARAEADYNRILGDNGKDMIALNIGEWETAAAAYLRIIEAMEKGDGNTATINGQVQLEDQPLAGVHVFLIDKALHQDYYSGTIRGYQRVITDADGSFVFNGLAPGRYALGIGVQPEQVQGYTLSRWQEDIVLTAGAVAERDLNFVPTVKLLAPLAAEAQEERFTFIWEPVVGAASYDLFFGPVTRGDNGELRATYTTILRSGLQEPQVTIDIKDEIARQRFNPSIHYEDGEINPRSILGLFYSEEYTWGVYAYDEHGNRISDSLGYSFFFRDKQLPLFKVRGNELTDADRLLLDKQFEAAIAAYLQQLDQNPRDSHSLLVLARLYQFGTSPGESDPETSARYYERLLQVEDLPEVREALGRVYYQAAQYDQAAKYYQSLLDTPAENWDTHYQLARIRFKLGKPLQALPLLEQALALPDGKYVRAFPVALCLLLGEPQQAMAFAARVEGGENYLEQLRKYCDKGYTLGAEFSQAMQAGQYRQGLQLLGDSEIDKFARGLLLYVSGTPRKELESVIRELPSGLPAELLLQMLR